MDLSSPISSVIPTAEGAVLAVLSGCGEPLSGRQVAAMVNGRFGQSRVNDVLGQLSEAGVVLREIRPPAKLYRLNRDHVAAAGVQALANQRHELLSRIRAEVTGWSGRAEAVWLFGSAARGDGDTTSDIDVLVVRPTAVDEDDQTWLSQIDDVSAHIVAWSGNRCEVLELSVTELAAMVSRGDPLVEHLRADALTLSGASPRSLLRVVRAKAAS